MTHSSKTSSSARSAFARKPDRLGILRQVTLEALEQRRLLSSSLGAPDALQGEAGSATTVDLIWRDNATAETSFTIQRRTGSAGTWATIASPSSNVVALQDTGLSAGTEYHYRLRANDGGGSSAWSNAVAVTTASGSGQGTYGRDALYVGLSGVTVVQAEDFDRGGDGVAYDVASNATSSVYRLGEDVVLGTVDAAAGGGFKASFEDAGDYLEYTLDVAEAGDYRLEARLASDGAGGTFKITFNGSNLTGTLGVPDTGGWQDYGLVTSDVTLSAGSQVMRVEALGQDATSSFVMDLDWVRIVPLEDQADARDDTSGADGPGFAPPATSGTAANGMRFYDGRVRHETTDLLSNGYGTPWGHTRQWGGTSTVDRGSAGDMPNGNGWVVSQAPHIRMVDGSTDTLVVVTGADSIAYFDKDGSDYVPRNYNKQTLIEDAVSGTFTVTDTMGGKWVFNDFDAGLSAAEKGSFVEYRDPYGNTTEVTSRDGSGRITEVQRTDGTTTESFVYAFISGGANDGLLESVTWRRKVGAGSWETVRSSHYAYYVNADTHGDDGDLKTVTVKDASANVIDTHYYRYWTTDNNGGESKGPAGQLKFAVSPDSFERADAVISGGILAATDAELAVYADQYYEYDALGRVTKHVRQGEGCSSCAGGLGEFTYEYYESNHDAGLGNWSLKTVEIRPDGTRREVFTNALGQTILDVERPYDSDEAWITFKEVNEAGQTVFIAHPTAVSGYDESLADLVGLVSDPFAGDNRTYIRDNEGLVETLGFATAGTAAANAATVGDDGLVEGWTEFWSYHNGEKGAGQKRIEYEYRLQTVSGEDIVYQSKQTEYRVASVGGTDPQVTSFVHTYYSGTFAVESTTVTLPTVATAQNGPNSASSEVTFFDIYGRPIWFRDADGFLAYTAYDVASGGVAKHIVDVDTTQTGDFSNLPNGWSTPGTGGLHLSSTYGFDALGRTVEATDPEGKTTYTIYDDADQEVRVYVGWDSTLNGGSGGPTGPTIVTRFDRAGGYSETLTMSATPATSGGTPTGTEAISGVESLSREHYNEAWQKVASDEYFDLSGLSYTTLASLGTEGTHYYRTAYAYDDLGDLRRVEDPTGTITRYVRDGLRRVTSEWIGTDDTPISGFWSPDNLAGTDILLVAAYEYDHGGVGNGLVTKETRPVDANPANDRITLYDHDFRNRLVLIRGGVSISGSDATALEHTYYTYDNLDRVTQVERFGADTNPLAWTYESGSPKDPGNVSGGPTRTHQSGTSYDGEGRVYQTHTYSVNPSTGSVSSGLITSFWHDRRGNVIKEKAPGGLVTKREFDGANRLTKTSLTDGGGDPNPGASNNWTHAGNVNGDIVLEEYAHAYDGASNLIFSTTKLRFHDATGTGPLGDVTTGPKARVSYEAFYYDNANRLTDSVDVGTNGGSSYTRPSSVPSRSDTVLVNSTTYSDAGWVFSTLDPRGIETRYEHDALGRRITLIEAYVDGVPSDADDRITRWTYNGNDQVLTMTADLPSGQNDQTTSYNYNARTSRGDAFNANNALVFIGYPSVGVGIANTEEFELNRAGQRTEWRDRNGTVHEYAYDLLGRVTSDLVTALGAAVDGTVRQITTSYDDAGRAYELSSLDGSSNVVNQVRRTYNGLGQVLREYQEHDGAVVASGFGTATPYVSYTYAAGAQGSRLTGIIYPKSDGGPIMAGSDRTLTYYYDDGLDATISRLSSIGQEPDDGVITFPPEPPTIFESYDYLGLDVVVRRERPEPNMVLTYDSVDFDFMPGDAGDRYAGLDRFGRVVDQAWYNIGTEDFADRFQYGHDRNGNRLYEENLLESSLSELYHDGTGYDALNRLGQFSRGTLNGTKTGLTGIASRSQDWSLDALGNWDSVTDETSTTQTRTHDDQNRLTGISGASSPTYSPNGEMLTDETVQVLAYDAWGRLVAVDVDADSVVDVTFAYDALNRKVLVDQTEAAGGEKAWYYTQQWQVLEERDASTGDVEVQYVWSPVYVDAIVLRDEDTDGDGDTQDAGGSERLYVLHDANFSVTALTDVAGIVQERFLYDPYGERTVLNADWTVDTDGLSDFTFVHGHQGGRHYLATGLVDFRNRHLDTSLGRWERQDPAGYVDGGNLYQLTLSHPVQATDPTGLETFRIPILGWKITIPDWMLKAGRDLLEDLGDDGTPDPEPKTPIDPDPNDPGRPNPNNPSLPTDIPNIPFDPDDGLWPPDLDGGTTDEGFEGSATFKIPLTREFSLIGGLGAELAFPETGKPDFGDIGNIDGLLDEAELRPFGRLGCLYWSEGGDFGIGGYFEDRRGGENDTFFFGCYWRL